jgi:hypothetical protein
MSGWKCDFAVTTKNMSIICDKTDPFWKTHQATERKFLWSKKTTKERLYGLTANNMWIESVSCAEGSSIPIVWKGLVIVLG